MMEQIITTTLDARAGRIRTLVETARGCIIEVGHELIAAKTEIGHGWRGRLDREFAWTEQLAYKYMSVARAFKSELIEGETLTVDASALYLLAAPDVSQVTREGAVEAARNGEHVTKDQPSIFGT